MEYSGLLHPEFGLLCPRPRLRRELRIAMTCLLLGAIAGALCVSGGIALLRSDIASLESAAALSADASRDIELGTAPADALVSIADGALAVAFVVGAIPT